MSNNQYIFIGEGKTEDLIKTVLGLVGIFMKFNIWDKDISSIIRKISYSSNVYLMIDADQHSDIAKLERLTENFNKLVTHTKNTNVLLQVNGLEDELIRGFGSGFDVNAKRELKKFLLNHASNEIKEKMNEHRFDPNQMWVTDGHHSYSFLNANRNSYKDLKRFNK